jgi:hypothetical protein
MLKLIIDFGTLLICAEGAGLLENAIAFSSCMGRFEDENQCPAGGRDRGDPAGACAEEASRTACGKRSASQQAENACHCGDYSKKFSLVEHKLTAKFNRV